MKDNFSSYKWGIFYWNPEDSRIIVPKITGLGWTFNFAKPISYILILGIILIIFLIMYLRK